MIWSWKFHHSSERNHQYKLQIDVKRLDFAICGSQLVFYTSMLLINQPIRKIMHKHRNKNQTNGRHNQNKEVNNDKFKVNKNQSTSRCTGQAVNHIWRNPNASQLSEVCTDDVIQKNNESSITKSSSSENKTPSKSSTQAKNLHHLVHKL
ncbi:unnamed protein product [Schistosoma mattheei]|uniref:Uncharacterized protein n=1 Tax=Schistosoma mattheei TaxID=31246 RepID=A0A183PQB3_9TREM|nr:unnamed protein product [Schistosoma mattheei]